MIVLDKICEFGEFYALSWKLKKEGGVRKEKLIFSIVALITFD